jgi:hypothetical protein
MADKGDKLSLVSRSHFSCVFPERKHLSSALILARAGRTETAFSDTIATKAAIELSGSFFVFMSSSILFLDDRSEGLRPAALVRSGPSAGAQGHGSFLARSHEAAEDEALWQTMHGWFPALLRLHTERYGALMCGEAIEHLDQLERLIPFAKKVRSG